jgi:FKBP-type peptidyl-prolyl cis-trans isomerase
MSEKMHRAAWLFLTALFIFTSVGLGLWAFWASTRTNQDATNQTTNQTKDNNMNKLAGTKMPNFTPVAHIESLQKADQTPGTGKEATPGATVTVHYTGALASDGTIFESSLDSGQPATFPLSGVIKGWTDGVPGMKVGGTRRLLIPAAQAYGSQANAKIPANSDLVFDITLLDVK